MVVAPARMHMSVRIINPVRKPLGLCSRAAGAALVLVSLTCLLIADAARHHHDHDGHEHHHAHDGHKHDDGVQCGARAMRHHYERHIGRHKQWKQVVEDTEKLHGFNETAAQGAGATRKLAASTPWTMRYHVEFQLPNLSADKAELIKSLVKSAVKSLQKFIKIKKPVSGRLLVPRQCNGTFFPPDKCQNEVIPNFQQPVNSDSNPMCGNAVLNASHFDVGYLCSSATSCTTFPAGQGEETDMYLYVTAGDDQGCDVEYLAYAIPCFFDKRYQQASTNRPLLGAVNICPSTISAKNSSFDRQLGIIAHEIIHAMGFEEQMYTEYIDDNGQPLSPDKVLGTVIHNGQSQTALLLPTVVKEAQAFFGCPTLAGAPLEDEGGTGTAMSHWEWRIFQGDVMASVLPQDGSQPQMGRMTLALLKDTGWYEPVWDYAGWVDWGRGQGCDFVQQTCQSYMKKYPSQRFFCSTEPNDESLCTHTNTAPGTCAPSNVSNGCNTIVAYNSLPGCLLQGSLDPIQLPFWKYGLNSRCYQSVNPVRKLDGSVINTWGGSDSSDAYCLLTRCEGGQVQVSLEGTWATCPSGGSLKLSSVSSNYQAGAFSPCPAAASVCTTFSCDGSCSGNGQCRSGTCYCNIAYVGANCSQRADGLPPFPPAPPGEVDAPPGPQVVRNPTRITSQQAANVVNKARNWISKNKSLVIIIAASVGAFIVVLLGICCIRKFCCAPKLRGAQYAPSSAPPPNPFATSGGGRPTAAPNGYSQPSPYSQHYSSNTGSGRQQYGGGAQPPYRQGAPYPSQHYSGTPTYGGTTAYRAQQSEMVDYSRYGTSPGSRR